MLQLFYFSHARRVSIVLNEVYQLKSKFKNEHVYRGADNCI